MTHEHDFTKDLDGQVTCSICGATIESKSQLKRITIEKEMK